VNVFGWVNPVAGQHGMIRQPKGNTDGFLSMLKTILCRYRRALIDLWVDQARWHKGLKVERFLGKNLRLMIHYIPKYHPQLNPQEILWRTMRYEETTNTYYESFEELRAAIFTQSQSWKPKKVLSLCHLI
jgi:transposase